MTKDTSREAADRGQRALAGARAICEELVHIGEENQSDIFASPEVIRLGILQPIITIQAELERLLKVEAAARAALEWADAHGESLRVKAQRTAISAEDWRYTNGYDAALKYFEPVRAALATDGAET